MFDSNNETSVTIGESVRDEDVFILQSTAPGEINDGVMVGDVWPLMTLPSQRGLGAVDYDTSLQNGLCA